MLFVIDFDGTLSVGDTVDAMLERFADDSWQDLEAEWLKGNISAIECMKQQLDLVKVDQVTLEKFFRGIQLDASFIPISQIYQSIFKSSHRQRRLRSCDRCRNSECRHTEHANLCK